MTVPATRRRFFLLLVIAGAIAVLVYLRSERGVEVGAAERRLLIDVQDLIALKVIEDI